MSVFFLFHERLQRAIVDQLCWTALRPVQEQASSAILEGNNLVVLAPTAGGKTEAAFFPILSQMLTSPQEGVQCLYISPIRALLNNQEARLGQYAEMVGLSRFKWHGEAKGSAKKAFIKNPDAILMTTPESLEVMLISPSVPVKHLFANLRFVVVDEIHALANCDRGAHLMSVLERLCTYTTHDIQRIGLSATVGNPGKILDWLQGSSTRHRKLINPPASPTKKELEVIYLKAADLPPMVSERAVGKKTLFFCNSRARTEKVAMAIKKRETSVFVHHSSISKEEREKAEEAITHGSNVCIVCTSTLELGIDVGELDRILQEECPSTVASFLQRMGRTGRRPNTRANTTFFTTHKETLLQAIALIELARSHWVENISLNHWSWHILVQQIMAMCLQFGAATRWHIWDTIHLAACFSKISEQSFHDLIDYMIGLDFLQEESGRLSMGREAEKTFGAKNFKELYAVFSSPAAYKVLTIGGQSLGTIEWQFADQMELPCCFRLDGSGWLVERLEHQSRTVYVTKATTNKTPTWGGYAPNILSYEICRQIFRIQTCDDDYPYCDPAAQEALNEIRQEKAFFRGHFAPLQVEDNYLHWWTFAGNRINTTLKLAISFLKETKIVSNNYALTMLFIHDPPHTINQILLEITQPAFWENQEFTQYLLDHLPMYRFSKFQPCLPESFQYQLIAQELLDIKGTAAFLVQFHKHAGVKRGRRP